MTAATCDLCTRPVADLAHVCTHCARGLAADLADIPELDAELDTTVSKQVRMVASGGGSRSSEPRMPVNLAAGDRGRQLKTILTGWAHLVADQRGVPRPLDGITPTARWLVGHVEWLRHHPAGADAVTEIHDAVHQARRAIDKPLDRVYAGPCNECGTPLYAKPGAPEVPCRECVTPDGGTLMYGVSERRAWMLATIIDLHMTPPQAAHALSVLIAPIKPELIRTWYARGKLAAAGVDEQGRTLYRVGDVAVLLTLSTQRKEVVAQSTIGVT